MRNLDQSILNIRQGLEPATVVGVNWIGAGQTFYGDIASVMDGVVAKIINMPSLETSLNAEGSGESQSITVKFDDTDGSILNILNSFDIYLAYVSVYQWFRNQPINFEVKLFEGSIVGPVTWNESDRTVEIQCTTRYANIQVGFSYDETNTPILQQALIGKVWPLPFGTPVNYPALALQEIPSGLTTVPFGVPDPSIFWQIAKLELQIQLANAPYQRLLESLFSARASTGSQIQQTFNNYWVPILQTEMRNNVAGLNAQIDQLMVQYGEQAKFALTSNVILGGYKFPQQTPVKCKVGDQLFTCTFLGQPTDVITNPNQACPVKIVPYYPPGYPSAAGDNNPAATDYSFNFPNTLSDYTGQQTIHVPTFGSVVSSPIANGTDGGFSITEGTSAIPNWALQYPVVKEGFTWISPGSTLTLIDDFDFTFLVSYLPGTLINVYAYMSYNGTRKLTQVPPRYYKVSTQGNFTFITMGRPLSIVSYLINMRVAESEDFLNAVASDYSGFVAAHVVSNTDWEDQIYVTFESSVGPNIVDILIWLIEQYTPYNFDQDSFDVVRYYQQNYPANFVVQDRPLVDDLMNDIAYQARCSLNLEGGIYYLTYLSIQYEYSAEITLDNIEEDTLKVSTTPVESLITRYTATWKPEYSPDYSNPNKVIIKNNNQKYGYIDGGHDFFIYNQFYLVAKSARFWSLRLSQVYKIVTMNVMLDFLNIEVQDTVLLNFSENIFANGPVSCICTSQTYDSETSSLTLEFWTPVKLGQMHAYLFAWPGDAQETDYYYPNELTTSGGALGYAPGNVPVIPYTALQVNRSTVDYSDWPNDPGDILGFQQSQQNWASQNAGYQSVASYAQQQADDQSQYSSNVASSSVKGVPVYVGDSGNPVNNANQRNTQTPQVSPESPTPVNTQPATDFSVNPNVTSPALPSNTGSTGQNSFPAQILSGSGSTYQVYVYTNGLDNDPVLATATEVHNDSTLNLDLNVWVTVIFVGNAYYIVQPSWSH